MDAIEITIYLVIAVIVGTMIFAFVSHSDFTKLYEDLRGSKEQEFRKLDRTLFVPEAVKFWQSCGLGEVNKTLMLYVSGDELNSTFFFNDAKKLNFCSSIQSVSNGCGEKEQLVMGTIILPRVVKLQCDPVSQILVVS